VLDMDILRYETLTGIIRDFEPEDLNWLNSGVLQEETGMGQEVTWDIKHVRRDIATFEGRGARAGRRNLQTIGQQHATLARTFKEKPLIGSQFIDLRAPGSLERQTLAEDQIARELEDNAMWMARQDNFMISQALQGSLAMTIDDQDIVVDYAVPASNKFKVGGGVGFSTIDTDWEDPSADILTDIKNFKLAVSRHSGRTAKRAWCSSRTMTALLNNDRFKEFVGRSVAGAQIIEQGYASNLLGLEWVISDETFTNEDGTVITPYLDEKTVVIHPAPDREWGCFRIGSDAVPKNDGSGLIEVIGKYAFSALTKNPPAFTLYAGYVRLPIIKLPAAIVTAKVIA